MARIAGIDLPREKKVEYALTSIYGIGISSAREIVKAARVDPSTRVRNLTESEVADIRKEIDLPYMGFQEILTKTNPRFYKEFIRYFVQHLVENNAPMEIHEENHRKLFHSLNLRIAYLKTLEECNIDISSLAQVPSPDGLRYARIQDEQHLQDALYSITDKNPVSDVSVKSFYWKKKPDFKSK